jgi:hypothetical protein
LTLSRHLLIATALAGCILPLITSPSPVTGDTFLLEPIDPVVQLVPPFETTAFRARLTHLGQTPGGYTCRAFREIPIDWFSSLCSENQCVIDSLDVFLSPAEEETLWVDVFPFGIPGSGTMELRVRAHDPPGEVRSHFVGAISEVAQLVVDDDDGSDHEAFAVDAFAGDGITAGVWPLWITPPLATDLVNFSSVYWLTGDAVSSTLTAADRAELTAFLDSGGRLMVSGQGLGADIGGATFYRDRLGATFLADNSGSTVVVGVAGDPIGDGLAFDIEGGTGAGNQSSPDAIEALDQTILEYGNGLGAGARVEGGGIYRTVYLPFGFEGVASAADRTLLITRIRTWLEGTPPVAIGDDAGTGGRAPAALVAVATPNPSPGPTRIVIEMAGTPAAAGMTGRMTVVLTDATGRLVARLPATHLGPGVLAAEWDGRTGGGGLAPGGVYFYRTEFDANQSPGARGRLVVAR